MVNFLPPHMGLTKREKDVLQYAAWGHNVHSTAYELGISPGTVKNHRVAAIKRTKADSTTQAVAIALRIGAIK